MSRAGLVASITMVMASTAGLATAAVPLPTPAPASFAARADKACAVAGAKILALPVPLAATVLPDLRANRQILLALSGQLKALKAPPVKAKTYAVLVAAVDRHAAILGAILTAAAGNQTSKISSLNHAAEMVAKRRSVAATALGLASCAKHYAPSVTTTTMSPNTASSPLAAVGPAPLAPSAPAGAVATGQPTGSAGSGGASGSGGSSAGTSATGASPAGQPSQTGTQTFHGTSSATQSVDTTGGGFLTAG